MFPPTSQNNQLGVERYADLTLYSNHNGMVQFSAPFPYQQSQMDGLTLAAVTKSSGPFANASDVAGNALFGPGIIEVD